jgi:hypothetical protein
MRDRDAKLQHPSDFLNLSGVLNSPRNESHQTLSGAEIISGLTDGEPQSHFACLQCSARFSRKFSA